MRADAGPDAALALLLVAEKMLRVSRAELDAAEVQLDNVRHTAEVTIAWARGTEAIACSGRDREADGTERANGALDRFAAAAASGTPTDALTAAIDLSRELGVHMPFQSMQEFDELMADSTKPFVLGPTTKPKEGHPTSTALETLGQPCESPFSASATALLRTLTNAQENLWVRPLAGIQVAIARPLLYAHHGLLLGDGSVVDYAGEPTPEGLRGAVVRRASVSEFLGGQRPDDLEQCILIRGEDRAQVAKLRPGVACARALSSVGQRRYNVLSNNCEHFASWASLGLPISAQVSWLADMSTPSASRMLEKLGYSISIEKTSVSGPVLDEQTDDELPVDLGRAFWAEDLQRVVIWLPLWEEVGEPVGGPDQPWTVDELTPSSTWHRHSPSIARDPAWHASLIGLPDGRAYWLTRDGIWLSQAADPLGVLNRRLEPAARILREIHAGPGKVASRLVQRSQVRKQASNDD